MNAIASACEINPENSERFPDLAYLRVAPRRGARNVQTRLLEPMPSLGTTSRRPVFDHHTTTDLFGGEPLTLGLKGRRVIVCGGRKRMSRAAARRCALEGAQVVLVARTPGTLADAAGAITAESGSGAETFATDLTTEQDTRRARRRVSCSRGARHQRRRASAPRRLPVHDPRRMAALVRRRLLLGDRAHPRLRARHVRARLRAGRECLDQFHQVPAERCTFARCRLALVGAIASLFREVAPHNVTINSVLPGLVSTAAMQVSLQGMAAEHAVTYETVEKEVRAWAAADRVADPEEVGDLIWMLCAAQMGYLTGQNIINNGGAYQGLFCGVATADSPNEATSRRLWPQKRPHDQCLERVPGT